MAQLGSFLRKDSKFHGKPKATSKHSSPTLTPPVVEKGDVAAERRKNLAFAGTETSSPVFV